MTQLVVNVGRIHHDLGQRLGQIGKRPGRVAIGPNPKGISALEFEQIADLLEDGCDVGVGHGRGGEKPGGGYSFIPDHRPIDIIYIEGGFDKDLVIFMYGYPDKIYVDDRIWFYLGDYDKVQLTPSEFRIPDQQLEQAYNQFDSKLLAAG